MLQKNLTFNIDVGSSRKVTPLERCHLRVSHLKIKLNRPIPINVFAPALSNPIREKRIIHLTHIFTTFFIIDCPSAAIMAKYTPAGRFPKSITFPPRTFFRPNTCPPVAPTTSISPICPSKPVSVIKPVVGLGAICTSAASRSVVPTARQAAYTVDTVA